MSELLDDEVPSDSEAEVKPSKSAVNVVATLEERLKLYTVALASAKSAGDSTKVRRLDRGLKTLQDMLKAAKSGREVNIEEMPPPVSANSPVPVRKIESPPAVIPPPVAPRPKVTESPVLPPPKIQVKVMEESKMDDTDKLLSERRDQYKKAALVAKHAGDKQNALRCFKIAKQFDEVITAHQSGQPVDLSNLPPPPTELKSTATNEATLEGKSSAATDENFEVPQLSASEEAEANRIFNAPPPPTSVVEALVQRAEKYKSAATKAKEDGDSSKARRMERLQKVLSWLDKKIIN